jgi:hypothetical protein
VRCALPPDRAAMYTQRVTIGGGGTAPSRLRAATSVSRRSARRDSISESQPTTRLLLQVSAMHHTICTHAAHSLWPVARVAYSCSSVWSMAAAWLPYDTAMTSEALSAVVVSVGGCAHCPLLTRVAGCTHTAVGQAGLGGAQSETAATQTKALLRIVSAGRAS